MPDGRGAVGAVKRATLTVSQPADVAHRDALVAHIRGLVEVHPEGSPVVLSLPRAIWMAVLEGGQSPAPAESDRWLTVSEVAARLQMSKSHVYREAGKWQFVRRVGRKALRFSEAGLRKWLAARRG